MQVVGAGPSQSNAPGPRRRQRLQVLLAFAVVPVIGALALLPSVGSPTPSAAGGIEIASSTTIPGPVYPLAQFPVQGKCSFTDTYGAARSGGRLHEGVDLIAKTGQFVYAVMNGTLTKQYVDTPGSLSGNGWRLTIPDGTYFFYAHFSAFPPGLSVGSKVVAGQIIGYVGETGNAGTPHLHFEIHPGGGDPINPTQSVQAIDACGVTSPPPVATNPTIPGQTAKPSVTIKPLSPAVRVSLTTSTTTATVPTTTPTTAPTTPTSTPTSTTTSTSAPATTIPSSAAGESAGAGRWQLIEPVVVFNGTSPAALLAGSTTRIKVGGVGAVSSATTGVLVRVSATTTAGASIVVHPCGSAPPVATTLFAEAGPMAIGVTAVPVAGGEICVTSATSASAKITVIGQIVSSGVGVAAVDPTRVFDSRSSGRLAANQNATVATSALGGSATKAVTATVTVLGPTSEGTLSIGACGGTALKAPFPNAPLSSFSAVVAVGAGGICLSSSVAADVVLDVDGQWRGDASGLMPVRATRVFDSRTAGSPLSATPAPVALTGIDGAPSSISKADLSVTVLGGATGGSVFVWNCAVPQPTAAVGVVAANKRATFSVVAAAPNGTVCMASNQPVDALVDVVAVG